MAFTARLPESVEADAKAYAEFVGVSMNALLAIALRDYLDARMPDGPGVRRAAKPPVSVEAPSPAPKPAFKPPASRSDPCPCGALDPQGHRLKWKHCHGKP